MEDILKNSQESLDNCFSDESFEEEVENKIVLPPLFAPYNSKAWTARPVKKLLQEYFALLGYGRGSKKQFVESQFKPVWWNEEEIGISWEEYECPSYGKKEQNKQKIGIIVDT